MHTALTSHTPATHGIADTRHRMRHEPRRTPDVPDAVGLAEENERLRRVNAELTTAAESWIRLYEAALGRANAAASAQGSAAPE